MFISIKKPLLIILATFSILSCNKKEAEYETNTFIKNWLILGPFPNCEDCGTENYKHGENCAGFYTDYLKSAGGEKNLIPTPGMKIEFAEPGLNMEWFSYKSETDKIPLASILEPKDMVVAYAFTQINCRQAQKSILTVGSNDGIQVFLNGEKVHENHPKNGRWLQADNDYVPVELKKGTNNLMLKIDQGTGDFGFVARFLDRDSLLTKIRKNLDSYKSLKVVAIGDTLVVNFGSDKKISVFNPNAKVRIELVHEKEGKIAEKHVLPGEDLNFNLPGLPEGFIAVKATFPINNKETITSETRYFKGKLKRHSLPKRLRPDLVMLSETGKPIFPIGTYGAPESDFSKLKEAGYNFVVGSPANLDAAHAAGLMVSVHINGHDINAATDTIAKYKNHPAILCWMMYDEPGYNRADLLYIYNLYNAIYKADPIHPSYLVITTPTVYKSFGHLCDVLAVDTYPITNGIITEVGDNIALAYSQIDGNQPVWHCGQMFNWPEQRRPNPREHRFMTYLSIIEGVKGMLWYTYKGYGQYLPEDDPELWEAQKIILNELNELSPLILEPGFGSPAQLVEENNEIRAIIKKGTTGTYLIAVNKSKTETFSPKFKYKKALNREISVFGENRKLTLINGVFTDEFKPLDVHIYKLD
ncbi:MAG: hypothetical protein DRI73_00830 [Bacteroidetes bacterium]|nr:MAG: hypothetical protein DRI73_00830 [Bacteroidota bacterium]